MKMLPPWLYPAVFSVEPSNALAWREDEGNKKLFGVALAKGAKPFGAACEIFADTTKALWVSEHWVADPIVLAAKDAYNLVANENLLDKDALAMRLLKFAEEKDLTGRFYIVDAKDRLAALRLYAEIQGFIGKIDINASTNTYTNNLMKIVFVKPDNQNEKTVIDPSPQQEGVVEHNPIPLNIKLVS